LERSTMTTKGTGWYSGWIAEPARRDEIEGGNQVFYLANPIINPNAMPHYTSEEDITPDTIVWVMCERWLYERLGYVPGIKRPPRVKSDIPSAAVRGLINSRGSDSF